MFRFNQLIRVLLLGAFVLLVLAPAAFAQGSSWAVAQRDDEGIRKLVDRTLPHTDGVPGAGDAAAIILYKETAFLGEEISHKICRNLIFLVKDAAKIDWLTQPWSTELGEKSERDAFVIRGDDLIRIDRGKAKVITDNDDLTLDRVEFELGELKQGDVVGWSIVVEREGPIFYELVSVSDRFPVVYSSVKVMNDGKSAFLVTGDGIPTDEFKLKTSGLVNDRPERWSVNLRGLPAQADLPSTPPYALDTPVITVAMSERYVERTRGPSGWVAIYGRVQTVQFLARAREGWLKETGGIDIHASAVTTGLDSAEEQERAVYEFVRDSIELVDGDGMDGSAERTVKEILKTKKASSMEKCILMLAMLDAVGVSAEMGVIRPESWGPVSEVEELTFASFYEAVVRCGGDLGRFYAPQCTDCEAGSLPSAWGDGEVFSPKPGVNEDIQAYFEKLGLSAFAESGRVDIRQIQRDAEAQGEKEGWYLIEQTGGE